MKALEDAEQTRFNTRTALKGNFVSSNVQDE